MTLFFSKLISFIMAAIAFLLPWTQNGKADADLTIQLDANDTTGYSWYCEIEDESILTLTGDSYKVNANIANMTGVGGTQYFYFDALSEGETEVTFTCSQQWVGGATEEPIVYTVTVGADMSVSYVLN